MMPFEVLPKFVCEDGDIIYSVFLRSEDETDLDRLFRYRQEDSRYIFLYLDNEDEQVDESELKESIYYATEELELDEDEPDDPAWVAAYGEIRRNMYGDRTYLTEYCLQEVEKLLGKKLANL